MFMSNQNKMKEWQSKKILFIGFLLFCLHVYGKDVYGSDVLYVKAKVVKVNNAIVHFDFPNLNNGQISVGQNDFKFISYSQNHIIIAYHPYLNKQIKEKYVKRMQNSKLNLWKIKDIVNCNIYSCESSSLYFEGNDTIPYIYYKYSGDVVFYEYYGINEQGEYGIIDKDIVPLDVRKISRLSNRDIRKLNLRCCEPRTEYFDGD